MPQESFFEPKEYCEEFTEQNEPLKLLTAALARVGWSKKYHRYKNLLEQVEYLRCIPEPCASAIIISHRQHPDTLACLQTIRSMVDGRCEVVFVSNGVPPSKLSDIRDTVNTFVQLTYNTGAFLARNLGALFSKGPILVFVEDDCIPFPNLIETHLDAYKVFDCISVRGIYEPKTSNPLNVLAKHYNLGNKPFPQYVVAEGNASYRANVFFAVGGWDDDIKFGGGGAELALRLLKFNPDMRRQIYFPQARIKHDYAVDTDHLKRKRSLQQESFIRLEKKHPDYRMLRYIYRKYIDCKPVVNSPVELSSLELVQDDLVKTFIVSALDEKTELSAEVKIFTLSALPNPDLSVIITTSLTDDTQRVITELEKRRDPRTEVVLVSDKQAAVQASVIDPRPWLTTACYSESNNLAALNLGIRLARGQIVLLTDANTKLDMAALRAHQEIHQNFDVIAVQGRVLSPDSLDTHESHDHSWYPAYEFPTFANCSVNVSYRRDALLRVGGWPTHTDLGGPALIAARLLRHEPDFRKQIFSPRPVAYRFTSTNGSAGQLKAIETLQIIKKEIADWNSFIELSCYLFGVKDLVPRRADTREIKGLEILEAFFCEHNFQRAKERFQQLIDLFPERAYTDFRLKMWQFLDLETILKELHSKEIDHKNSAKGFERYKKINPFWFFPELDDYIEYLTLGPDKVDKETQKIWLRLTHDNLK